MEVGENGHLQRLKKRAIEWLVQKRRNEPACSASVKISQTIWGTEIKTQMHTSMVQEVRENLDGMNDGCSVCCVIAGEVDDSHLSGEACPRIPLGESTEGWSDFKEHLQFAPGIVCYNCLLPTVRVRWLKSNSDC